MHVFPGQEAYSYILTVVFPYEYIQLWLVVSIVDIIKINLSGSYFYIDILFIYIE